jgi:hypothetical protein
LAAIACDLQMYSMARFLPALRINRWLPGLMSCLVICYTIFVLASVFFLDGWFWTLEADIIFVTIDALYAVIYLFLGMAIRRRVLGTFTGDAPPPPHIKVLPTSLPTHPLFLSPQGKGALVHGVRWGFSSSLRLR